MFSNFTVVQHMHLLKTKGKDLICVSHLLKFNTRNIIPGKSRDSEVGIATGYGLDDREVGVRVPVGSGVFSSPRCPDWLWGPIQWVPGAVSPGVKRPGREANHSPPTGAEVKKMLIYTSTLYTPSWHSA
jgi:hypothetical protein